MCLGGVSLLEEAERLRGRRGCVGSGDAGAGGLGDLSWEAHGPSGSLTESLTSIPVRRGKHMS